MTANETPAALLRRAADRLDRVATGTTTQCGPWRADQFLPDENGQNADAVVTVIHNPEKGWQTILFAADAGTPADAEYIAALGPQVAPHLSAWLRGHADYIEGVQCSATPESLAFARSILGEAETS